MCYPDLGTKQISNALCLFKIQRILLEQLDGSITMIISETHSGRNEMI